MIKRLGTIACLIFCMTGIVRAQATQPAEEGDSAQLTRSELSRRVDFSIGNAVKYLLSRQSATGAWDQSAPPDQVIGNTALVTLALLSSGQSHQTPALNRAITFLKQSRPENSSRATYSIALRASVYAMLPEAMRREELRRDLLWLQRSIITQGPNRGMYDYGMNRILGGDYSNSQYGVLGVWYASQASLETPLAYWKEVEAGWLNGQREDGGWGYRPNEGPSYGSMTAAAIATLFITNDFLYANQNRDLSKNVESKPLDAAMKWLADNFAADRNPGREPRQRRGGGLMDLLGEMGNQPQYQVHYMLFGYERVGEASGLTEFGTHRWYDEGAEYLLKTQAYDGSWTGTIGPEADTAYSLLFLSRGRSPVVMQKLQYDGRWNNRPRDATGFTQFMRRATERHVNWQIVSADASTERFRDSPLLYVASDKAINLSPEQKATVRDYVQQGGMLICANDGPRPEFSQSIEALGTELFPGYTFRDLPPDHLIYTANFPSNPTTDPIRALSNGVRELIILFPRNDMSWKWQSTRGGFLPRNSPYATLANTWLYATDRANPHYRGEDTWIARNDGVTASRNGIVGRLIYSGNWDPEPAGWTRVGNVLHNFDQFDLTVEPIGEAVSSATTQPAAIDPKRQAVIHITGTRSIQLSTGTKLALKKYIDGGGLLLLDAAGGSQEAAGSFEPLLREIDSTISVSPLPLDHPIYHATQYGGKEIERVTYRRSQSLDPVHIPRLRGAYVGKKLVGIVSYEDVSGGLVGYSTAGLTGYMPPSATDLVRNIILWRTSALR